MSEEDEDELKEQAENDDELLDKVAKDAAASKLVNLSSEPVPSTNTGTDDADCSPSNHEELVPEVSNVVPNEKAPDEVVAEDDIVVGETLVICEPDSTTTVTIHEDGSQEGDNQEKSFSLASEEGRQHLRELSQELMSLNEEGRKTFRNETTSEEGTPKRKQKEDRKRKRTTGKKGESAKKSKKPKAKAGTSETLPSSEPEIEPVTELDRILEDTAERNNLTVQNVKNILRRVITNEHVLAMLRNSMLEEGETGTEEEAMFEPKFTRAKARELMGRQPHLLWPVSPVKPQTPTTSQKLLQEEFADESDSDEEYRPVSEESEDDSESLASASFLSGHASPPHQPDAVPSIADLESSPEKGRANAESPLPVDKEGVIAERTRSKLPLNDTPLESIEAQFIAPDITMDMYDTKCDDEEWKEFLVSFSKPLDVSEAVEDNDAEDPEYNFLEEDEDPDSWDLRNDRAVKISKKEVNELMTELMQVATKEILDAEDDEDVTTSPQKPASRTQTPAKDTGNAVTELTETEIFQEATELVHKECYEALLPRQLQQLEEQMRMHVQLLTQVCVLSSNNDTLSEYFQTSEMLLKELHRFAHRPLPDGRRSYFLACNLDEAVAVLDQVPRWGGSTPLKVNRRIVRKNPIRTQVPSHVRELLCESRVFMYPELLPVSRLYCPENDPFRKVVFLPSEDHLLALGLEQFVPPKGSPFVPVYLKLVHTFLLPVKTEQQIKIRIKNIIYKPQNENNPIRYWAVNRTTMPLEWEPHPLDIEAREPPSKQPISILPAWMQNYLLTRSCVRPSTILPVTTVPNIASSVLPVGSTVLIASTAQLVSTPITIQAVSAPFVVASQGPVVVSPLKTISPIRHASPLRHISPLRQISPIKQLSPLKQISPILKKYNHIAARRILPNTPASVRKRLHYTQEPSSRPAPSAAPADTASPVARPSTRGKDSDTQTSLSLKDPAEPSSAANGQAGTSAENDVGPDDTEDDEGDLAALMAASSTIRRTPHSLTRKQSKQQRDTEATLALLAPNLVESDPQKEDREAQLATSYLQKVQDVLQDDEETFQRFMRIVDEHGLLSSDKSAAQVFEEVAEVFAKYPELVDDFVSFLPPEQAVECGKFTEYLLFSKIRLFLRKLEVHFSQQPQQLQRILKTLNQVQRQPDVTAETLCSMLQPLLRGQSHLLDEFLKLLPSQKVPESDMMDFEEVTIPDGEGGEEEDSCEEVTLSPVHETLGTKECPCPCHQEGSDARYVSRARHCTKCGIKFLDGRVFIQTGKVLRPAHVIFGSLGPSPPWRGSLPRSPTTKSPLRSPPETSVTTVVERPMSPISLSGDIGKSQDSAVTDGSTKQDSTPNSCCVEPSCTDVPGQQPPIKSWSREEDCVLLQSCQRLGSEKGIEESSGVLGRPRDQVQARFHELMALFEAHSTKDES